MLGALVRRALLVPKLPEVMAEFFKVPNPEQFVGGRLVVAGDPARVVAERQCAEKVVPAGQDR